MFFPQILVKQTKYLFTYGILLFKSHLFKELEIILKENEEKQ